MQIEDKYIIQKCLDGETEAFGFLVDRYRQSVYAFAYSKLRNRQDAEDVTQKVFIKAYQKLRTLKQWDNMHAWLYSITANMCKDWVKVQSRRPDRSFIEDQDPKKLDSLTTDSQDNDVMIESLNEALESLPEIYRQVLTLYYLGDRDSREIANFLGISPTSVRQRLARARDLLKEEMIAMMSKTYETQRLPVGFTFRVVESIRRIKIDSISIGKGVPWGLSLATGLLIAVIGLNPQFVNMIQIDLTNLAVSGESSVLETGDFPVDIAKISQNPFIVNQEGADTGKSSDSNLMQNAFFMAPQAEGGTWAKKADMLTRRFYHSSSNVYGRIYVISGADYINGKFIILPTVEEYDPVNGKWTKKADILTPRYLLTTCAFNGKIYAFGGAKDPSGIYAQKVEEYDPIDDKWVEKSDMPDPRLSLSACALNGKIYVFGGDKQDSVALPLVDEYDPVKDSWTSKSDMPVARMGFATEEINGKIYVFGGETGKWAEGPVVAQVDEYDPVKDTWKRKADMLTPRGILGSFVANGFIYAVGGLLPGPKVLSSVERYDPSKDEWEKVADMPTSRLGLSASIAENKAYAIGGCEAWVLEQPGTTIVEEYTPENWNSVSPQGKLPTKWGEIKR